MSTAMAPTPGSLMPTYVGFIQDSRDVCLLLEAIVCGRLVHVPRRPHERERLEIVRSGNVFIYEESTSGVKRWTDGINWSPSRIMGNFLIYREMIQEYPGEGGKKVAVKKERKCPSETDHVPEHEVRKIFGSLTNAYPFKPGGLLKKTITVDINGVPHHIVSYYKAEDIVNETLTIPSKDPFFNDVIPREELLKNKAFKQPVEHETLSINEQSEAYITAIPSAHGSFGGTAQGYLPHGLPIPHGPGDHNLPIGPLSMGLPSMQPYGGQQYGAQPPLTYPTNLQLPGNTMAPPAYSYPAQQEPQLPSHTAMASGFNYELQPQAYSGWQQDSYSTPQPQEVYSTSHFDPQPKVEGGEDFTSHDFQTASMAVQAVQRMQPNPPSQTNEYSYAPPQDNGYSNAAPQPNGYSNHQPQVNIYASPEPAALHDYPTYQRLSSAVTTFGSNPSHTPLDHQSYLTSPHAASVTLAQGPDTYPSFDSTVGARSDQMPGNFMQFGHQLPGNTQGPPNGGQSDWSVS